QALGFDLELVRGVHADVMKAAARGDQQALEQVEASILKGLARMTDEGRPSTGQDILKGRRTEIDFINGLVAEKGDEAGIPTPTHKALVEVVKEVERQVVKPDPALVERVWQLAGREPATVTQRGR
ncbi:MAG TPA: ketopantoate reductase C-terminal domain-containing protein, partial [Dehalococcoidia bacterium]|nr:ketopantoate reductase C-terminal domain-containing protein [Dehalococcoidia bacterium]